MNRCVCDCALGWIGRPCPKLDAPCDRLEVPVDMDGSFRVAVPHSSSVGGGKTQKKNRWKGARVGQREENTCLTKRERLTPAMENTTILSCKNISAVDGYTYKVPSSIPSAVLQDEDCEQEWKNKAGEFLSDGHHQANKTEHRLVLHESRKNITVSECIDLHHSVTCHGSNQKFIHTYQVINDTTLSFEQQPNST
ncbi:hypothetical protein AMELA_G00175140, partial [Ameiurus melas]